MWHLLLKTTLEFLSEFSSRDEGHGESEWVMSTCCAGRLSRFLFTEHYWFEPQGCEWYFDHLGQNFFFFVLLQNVGAITSPHSLNPWIHYFFTGLCSLQPVNSLKIQWNHWAYRDTFCCSNLNSKIWLVTCHFPYNSHFVHLHYHLFGPWWCDFSRLSQSRGFDFIVQRSPKWHSWSFTVN
jgi:hypothetical protein